jgi:hypothetical protein
VPVAHPDAARRRREASGGKTQDAVLLTGQWAEHQQPGTSAAAYGVLILRYPKVNDRYGAPFMNNRITVGRAIRALEHMHVLRRDRDTGQDHVATAELAAWTATTWQASTAPAVGETLTAEPRRGGTGS